MIRWHSWHDVTILPSNARDRVLEAQLGWSAGTLAVLKHAFALRLPRSVGWQAAPSADFSDAARYYKRGVMLQGQPQARPAPHTQLQGVAQLADLQPYYNDSFVVCDRQVAQLYKLSAAATVIAAEEHKQLSAVAELRQVWQAQGQPQRWTIVGGGIVLDVAAFAAALCQAQTVLVPTTLLAMIDAAHGGKNGVNFAPWGKNQLGTYRFAEQVVICPQWLATLPGEEVQAGGWEGVKHAFVAGDAQLLETWLRCLDAPPRVWQLPLLQTSAQVKTDIVQQDPYEGKVRRVLNFGHTLAHALEALSQENHTPLRHGHAVGIGILYAILLSRALGKISALPQLSAIANCTAMLTRTQLSHALGCKLEAPELWPRLQHYIAQDKKQQEQQVWILLQANKPLPRVNAELHHADAATQQQVWQQVCRALPARL